MIRVHELRKQFGDIHAVNGISFEVKRGETFGLLGPNGAGKTTTMRMLSALSPVTSGSIEVGGIDVSKHGREVREILGVVTQHDGHDNGLTVMQNLSLQGYLEGLSRKESKQRAMEVLTFFGLQERANANVYELSGGMKRRLAISRALLTRPPVVILDEPTTGLDPQSRNRVWEQLSVMKRDNVTVLMSTHYMEEAATLCDRIAIMDHGQILDEGTPDELITRHAGEEVAQVRTDSRTAMQALRERLNGTTFMLHEAGAMVTITSQNGARPDISSLDGVRVTYRPGNLEDVFITLTGRELRDE
jgi:lipooligosaccharide transport system ATP-binding protein